MFSKKSLACKGRKKYLAAVIPLIMAAQAQGLEFYSGGFEAKLDTQLSMGSSWRVESAKEGVLVDPNGNDGNKNYQKDDAFSQVFKGSNDLQLSYENYGAFVRTKYWYDAALENDNNLDDSNNHTLAKYSGAEVFDAFVYGEFEVLDMPIDVRLGKQVVSWGESTFILGSINQVNSYDVSAFNRPGAKIKEAVIPVNMLFANVGLTENLSVEAFYQLEYRETVLDGCGTFFSSNDYAAEGCNPVVVDEEFALFINQDDDFVRRPDGDGQFGLAARFVSEALDTEFGLYAMNIHSRTPTIGGRQGQVDEQGFLDAVVLGGALSSDPTQAFYEQLAIDAAAISGDAVTEAYVYQAALNSDTQSFYIEYPEDTQIYGLSFATNVVGVAVSGEVSYQVDVPMNYNSYQITGALVVGEFETALENTFGNDPVTGAPVSDEYYKTISPSDDSQDVAGFDLYDVTQVQVTAIQLIDQVLGASSIALIGEAGFTHFNDFDEDGVTKYEGSALAVTNTATQDSWGYRALLIAEYTDVFAGVTLSPELYWSHDVSGVSGLGGSAFKEGNKRLGLTLNANYLNTYNASVSYTQISGEDDDLLSDRDFASISLGMQF